LSSPEVDAPEQGRNAAFAFIQPQMKWATFVLIEKCRPIDFAVNNFGERYTV